MRTATNSDGFDVAYYDLGGDGPPLLFAHATGFHGHIWQPIAERLAGDFHCWSFDERGHGDTPAPTDGHFDWNGFARDAMAVIEAEGLVHPFGVGHSGGGAALLLAEITRPGTFRALYTYEPIVMPSLDALPSRREGGNPLAEGARRRREVFPSRQAAWDNYASKPPMSEWDPAALHAYVDWGFDDLDDGTVRLKCRGENEARTYEMATEHGAFPRLAEVTCPVTVAAGETTTTFGPDITELQARQMAHGRAEILPGIGHFGPMEDPEEVADSIRRAFAAAG
ncbi:MAG TPA: alpha/beta hydrolase [Acidimicrobiales bacterium]|nr:alpha/beta hydrolase [Acidimicrobiales bacterium]